MNGNLLKGFMVSKGINVVRLLSKLSEKGVCMSKNTFYRNIKGINEFDRKEILAIAEILSMTDNDILDIFFSDKSL